VIKFYVAPIILSRYWNFHQSNQTCDLVGAGVNQAEGRIWPAGRQLAIAVLDSGLIDSGEVFRLTRRPRFAPRKISLRAWIMCVYSVHVVPCVASGLATGWSLVQRVLRLFLRLKKWKINEGPTQDCRAVDKVIGTMSDERWIGWIGNGHNPIELQSQGTE
jgi:hypothetical protein